MSRKKIVELDEMDEILKETRSADMQLKMKMAEKLLLHLKMPLQIKEITHKMLDITPEMHNKLNELRKAKQRPNLKHFALETIYLINKFTYMDIRETLMESYIEKQVIPTRESLIVDLEHRSFICDVDNLNSCLKRQGFIWRRLPGTTKSILTEHPKRVFERHRYFNKIIQYRAENRAIYYIEEEERTIIKRKPKNGPTKNTLLAVFTEHGFVTNFLYAHTAPSKKSFFGWIHETLLLILPKNSVVVIEEKLNYEQVANVFPNGVNSKEDIKEWLSTRSIPYEKNMCKADLMALVNKFTKETKTMMEDIFVARGHEVLRRQKGFPNLSVLDIITKAVNDSFPKDGTGSRMQLVDVLRSYKEEQWKQIFAGVKLEETKILKEDLLLDEVIDKIMEMTAEEGLEKNCNLDDYEIDIEDYVIEIRDISPVLQYMFPA